ncbi:cofilin/actin-depolymerizing factor homolog isoform X1 [Mercenaria mercenaria]|uniref:cofilin/actin-depolymerizing factor homolog isoform X1 n=1 Tax=Mercenaria mercenaria TaxID=6596 RepID=UPI00234F4E53|nr:cofilin/actin-depolymerizing factor homolog isoform X1 [Mercenaria mercenaria]
MSSGIKVKDECKATYEEMKSGHKHSYVIFKIDKDMKNIVVDCVGSLGESYDSFCEKLIEAGNNAEGRYAVIDCEYAKAKTSKLVFMMWLPDNQLGIKQKMIYSSSKKALREKLQGIGKEMQCNDTDDLAWSNLVEKCQSKYD